MNKTRKEERKKKRPEGKAEQEAIVLKAVTSLRWDQRSGFF